jgi:mono/diheme cytochrome c family protein
MIDAKKSRRLIRLVALLWAMLGMAVGPNDGGSKSACAAEAQADAAAGDKPTLLTLEELKAAGASRSSYQHFQPRSVATETPKPDLAAFRKDIQPVLNRSCVECHGPDAQEGNIRIDSLDPDLLHGSDVNWWLEILAVLSKGEMPPADGAALADADRSKLVEWLSSQIQLASTVRRAEQGHSSFRRMTRYEYNYALQDLLGLPYDFAKDLPPDPVSEDGFQNSSETLHMSAIQFETYRELGRNALKRATVRGERPEPSYWGVSMKAASADEWTKQEEELEKIRQQHKDDPEKLKQEVEQQAAKFRVRPNAVHYKDLATGRAARVTWRFPGAKYAWKPSKSRPEVPADFDQVAVIPPNQKLIVELGDAIPDAGTLRVRVRASRASADHGPAPSLQLEFG